MTHWEVRHTPKGWEVRKDKSSDDAFPEQYDAEAHVRRNRKRGDTAVLVEGDGYRTRLTGRTRARR